MNMLSLSLVNATFKGKIKLTSNRYNELDYGYIPAITCIWFLILQAQKRTMQPAIGNIDVHQWRILCTAVAILGHAVA
jgi:hypothetical protein